MVAAASAEWRLAKSNEPAVVAEPAVEQAIAKEELRRLLVIASTAETNPGPDDCLLAEGLTSTRASPVMLSPRELPKASIIHNRKPIAAEHLLLGGLECFDFAGNEVEPAWRPLAAPADGYSSSTTGECSSGSERPVCRRTKSDSGDGLSNLQPPAESLAKGVDNADTETSQEAIPKWFQPSDAVKIVSSPNCNDGGRARVLLVDRAEARYKVRMRNGTIRMVPADQVRPLRPSLREAPPTIRE